MGVRGDTELGSGWENGGGKGFRKEVRVDLI